MTRRAAIYCRISQDRGGAGLGVTRQEEDCRALSARKGWDVVAFGVDRLWIDPDTGTRLPHRIVIPFRTAEGTELEQHPDTDPARIYALLSEAGHKLHWTETASARMPLPDERTVLQLPDATPVLHTTRITYGHKNTPLLLEELCVNGNRGAATYRITAEATRQLHAVRD